MIIELCFGGPHDGLKIDISEHVKEVENLPFEWRAPSRCAMGKDSVYTLREEKIKEGATAKFDFAGYADAIAVPE